MKKFLSVLLVVLMLWMVTGCSNTETNPDVSNDDEAVEVTPEEETPKAVEVNKGDTVSTDNFDIKIKKIEISHEVLPEMTDGFYNYYEAEDGKVYIFVAADVTNKSKNSVGCDEIGSVTANYNDGYEYSSFVAVEDSSIGFTYANISSIEPLMTQGVKFIIECPAEIEENDNPLFLTFNIDGKEFIHTIR